MLTIHVYSDAKWREAPPQCERGWEYALTGAFFTEGRAATTEATAAQKFSA